MEKKKPVWDRLLDWLEDRDIEIYYSFTEDQRYRFRKWCYVIIIISQIIHIYRMISE